MNVEEAFREISQGNVAAYSLCRSFYEFVHVWDDLNDGDNEALTPFGAVSVLLNFIDTLSNNPFYQKHKAVLGPVIHVSAFAWAASEGLRKSEDVQKRLAAEVEKSGYQQVFFYTAFLCGGLKHAADMDAKHRAYVFG